MDAVEYLKTKHRMGGYVNSLEAENPEEAVAIVEEWLRKATAPRRFIDRDEFLTKFENLYGLYGANEDMPFETTPYMIYRNVLGIISELEPKGEEE